MASRTCWNCEQYAHLAPMERSHYSEVGDIWTQPYICDSCEAFSVAQIEDDDLPNAGTAPGAADRYFEEPDSPISWLPVRVLGKRFVDVPDATANAASEAYACYSICSYRAAILLARAVVEAVAKNKGITKGSLASKIADLEEERIVSPLTAQTADEIRFIGNDMAHGDFVQAVSEEECDDVLNFMSVLLQQIYQEPAKLTRFQNRRLKPSDPKQAND